MRYKNRYHELFSLGLEKLTSFIAKYNVGMLANIANSDKFLSYLLYCVILSINTPITFLIIDLKLMLFTRNIISSIVSTNYFAAIFADKLHESGEFIRLLKFQLGIDENTINTMYFKSSNMAESAQSNANTSSISTNRKISTKTSITDGVTGNNGVNEVKQTPARNTKNNFAHNIKTQVDTGNIESSLTAHTIGWTTTNNEVPLITTSVAADSHTCLANKINSSVSDTSIKNMNININSKSSHNTMNAATTTINRISSTTIISHSYSNNSNVYCASTPPARELVIMLIKLLRHCINDTDSNETPGGNNSGNSKKAEIIHCMCINHTIYHYWQYVK